VACVFQIYQNIDKEYVFLQTKCGDELNEERCALYLSFFPLTENLSIINTRHALFFDKTL
jgi:hypothetical protein